ncbi:hypothetical protein L873DRAFT_906797 [Choiromyces venosus 120613-1]|uniref:Uncharacterized protein n=1 Tax=Choiromyces venosus 120613-1 TaxID=1336337 RepID=A0A3N4JTI0_9PEZI|nr:hypothetical protein L873DRAFT_906797 [Choiromyces venosus 120613-1]
MTSLFMCCPPTSFLCYLQFYHPPSSKKNQKKPNQESSISHQPSFHNVMSIEHNPYTHRETLESVDPFDGQWYSLEDVTLPSANELNPASPGPPTITPTAEFATSESILIDPPKKEYLYRGKKNFLIRGHINDYNSLIERKPPREERLSRTELLSEIFRVGILLDRLAKLEMLMEPSSVALYYTVQYALRGEFTTIEQAAIRGCGPQSFPVAPSAGSSSSPVPHLNEPPSAEGKKKKRVSLARKKVKSSKSGRGYNLNSCGAKFLRMGMEQTAIREHFNKAFDPWSAKDATTTTTTPTTPKRSPPPIDPVPAAATHLLPTSCRKPDTGTLPRAFHSPGNEFTSPIPVLPLPNFAPTDPPLNGNSSVQRPHPSSAPNTCLVLREAATKHWKNGRRARSSLRSQN